ncbi:MAG: carboxypeptidase regulatory-like domain-containing protein [Nitrospirae bacterium]|nr:carboxypeptidase regulatory-like domain-containing protein [Nitrospirota bacterium]
MPRSSRFSIAFGAVFVAAAMGVALWTCSDSEDKSASSVRVEFDLDKLIGPTEGTGAGAKKITSESDLIGGEAAQGRVGDTLLQNDKIRVIIQQPDRNIGPGPFGGNIIDGDIVRSDGKGQDVIGEISVFFNLGRTVDAKTVEVVRDGSKGGAAVVAATGPDEVLDYLNIRSVVSSYLPGLGDSLPVNPDEDMPLTITNYYILKPGDSAVRFVTAIHNEGSTDQILLAGDLLDSGGTVEFFNPSSTLAGFGYKTAIPEKMNFLGFRGKQSSYAYAPPLKDGKENAAYLAISGVAGTVIGTVNVIQTLLSPPPLRASTEGALVVPAGGTASYERWVAVGTGSLSTVTDALYSARQIPTGQVEGTVADSSGSALAGVRVSAINNLGAAVTQFLSDASGKFSGTLPAGTYSLSAQVPGRLVTQKGSVTVSPGAVTAGKVVLSKLTQVSVNIASPGGTALPGKVSFLCADTCPEEKSSQLRDISYDSVGDPIFQQDFIDNSGKATVAVAPGTYKVVVSRGITYSLWPNDFRWNGDVSKSGGYDLTLAEGETKSVAATLAKVVDTSEYLSGDFHVHAINSPDSPVPNLERVITFLGEGVDVLVSSDHDYVTDFAPTVKDLNAGSYLATIVGNELTTFDYGHFNGFPVQVKAGSINGGAFDWGGGTGPSAHPGAIFEQFLAEPGEQVVQVNHPDWGYFKYILLDVKSGATAEKPSKFRMADPEGSTSADTKLLSEKFNAIELYNGFDAKRFNVCANWWLGLINRGVVTTGTAVSDTHQWRATQSGFPRSYIRVGAGKDKISPFDEAAFVAATNAHRLFGTNGPFVRLHAANAKGEKVETGDTLASGGSGQTITFTVEVQTPAWFKVNKVDLISNVTDTIPAAGKTNDQSPKPLATQEVKLTDADLQAGAEGGADYKRYVATVTFTDAPQKDSYYVALVSGEGNLYPVVTDSVAPFAFTNPVFVDVNGGGWKPMVSRQAPPRWAPEVLARVNPAKRQATEADFWALVKIAQTIK